MKVKRPNDPCVHCKTKVKKKVCPFTLKKLHKVYFYTHLLQCPGCGAIYFQEQWKITKAQVTEYLNNK